MHHHAPAARRGSQTGELGLARAGHRRVDHRDPRPIEMTRKTDNPGYDPREGMKPIQHPDMFEAWRACGRSMTELAKLFERSRPFFYRMAADEDWQSHADAMDAELAESIRLAQEQAKHRHIEEVSVMLSSMRTIVAESIARCARRMAGYTKENGEKVGPADVDFQEINALAYQFGTVRDQGAKHFGLDKLTLEVNKSASFADEVAAAMKAVQE